MQVSFNTISFTGEKDAKEKRKEAEKKVVTGGGATAAAVSASRAKATKSAFDVLFASSKKVSQGLQTVTTAGKTATEVAKKSTSLWAKVCENAKWAKNAILNWGTKFKNMKYIKPLVNSKPFMMFAGALGYGFGLITLISGCSDIARVATDVAQGGYSK